jgi:hypothetical protein
MNETNEKLRKFIIENYKENIPDIEQHIYRKKYKQMDYSGLSKQMLQKVFDIRYQRVISTVIDIRNNSDPISPESNTIIKSDNTYSNETKRMIKVLIAKGWTYDEIAFEMERIYGMGTIAKFEYFENVRYREYLILFLFSGIGLYFTYRLIRPGYRYFKKFIS